MAATGAKEVGMNIVEELQIFNKFNFERPPVGVKYLALKPQGIDRITKRLHICEMLVEAHLGEPFYAQKEDITCVGPLFLGMIPQERVFESGMIGPKLEVFKEPRANQRLYQAIPRLPGGSVKYVAFAPLDRLTFDPDVFIITSDARQAEIITRAVSYVTGKVFSGRGTPVVSCSYVYAYPYLTGDMNFTIVPVGGFGINIMPDNLVITSLPYDMLPGIVESLKDMNWYPEMNTISRPELKIKVDRITEEIAADLKNDDAVS